MMNMDRTARTIEVGYHEGPSDQSLRLAWLDESGQIRCAAGKCIDLCSTRIHVEVSKQIPLRTRVMLRAGERRMAGSAFVKYVTHYGAKFIVVLETA